jgi:hypothetical protein
MASNVLLLYLKKALVLVEQLYGAFLNYDLPCPIIIIIIIIIIMQTGKDGGDSCDLYFIGILLLLPIKASARPRRAALRCFFYSLSTTNKNYLV